MEPFLQTGDWLSLRKALARDCVIGDIVCFEEDGKRPVCRVVAIEAEALVLVTDRFPEQTRRISRKRALWKVVSIRGPRGSRHAGDWRWRWGALGVVARYYRWRCRVKVGGLRLLASRR